jgi:hypothetical protein
VVHGETAQCNYETRLDNLKLSLQIRRASLDFTNVRVPVGRGPALDHVGDEDTVTIKPDAVE